ncbi:hypothetical protein [Hymenobacter metallicola]|nr:hypothetical protein [Hymenobacter metallicola]
MNKLFLLVFLPTGHAPLGLAVSGALGYVVSETGNLLLLAVPISAVR